LMATPGRLGTERSRKPISADAAISSSIFSPARASSSTPCAYAAFRRTAAVAETENRLVTDYLLRTAVDRRCQLHDRDRHRSGFAGNLASRLRVRVTARPRKPGDRRRDASYADRARQRVERRHTGTEILAEVDLDRETPIAVSTGWAFSII